jgi:hypothetical protein
MVRAVLAVYAIAAGVVAATIWSAFRHPIWSVVQLTLFVAAGPLSPLAGDRPVRADGNGEKGGNTRLVFFLDRRKADSPHYVWDTALVRAGRPAGNRADHRHDVEVDHADAAEGVGDGDGAVPGERVAPRWRRFMPPSRRTATRRSSGGST